jgi:hypothetical protein
MAEIAMPVEIEWAPEERASFQRLTLALGRHAPCPLSRLGLVGLIHAPFPRQLFPQP